MMRRGLWQQKQKRPSVCLLCRFSYSYGPYTRPALRPSSSPDGTPPNHDSPSPAPVFTFGQSTRSYSVVAGRGRHEEVSRKNPRAITGLEASAALTQRHFLQRGFSTNGLPNWATQQAQPAAGDSGPSWASQHVPPSAGNDGLLPHERAAREKARARARPTPVIHEEASKPTATNDGLLPHERAARERAAQPPPRPPPRNPAPGWASAAAPSWSTPRAQPAAHAATADSDLRKPTQQADSPAFLLPHERAARERAAAARKPSSSTTLDSQPPVSAFSDTYAPRYGVRRPNSAPTQTPADQGEWKNLARRDRKLPSDFSSSMPSGRQLPPGFSSQPPSGERKLPPGFSSSPPSIVRSVLSRPRQSYPGNDSKDGPDPWSALKPSTSGKTAQVTNSATEADPFKLMERTVAQQQKAEKKMDAVADAGTWDWAEKHTEEARKEKVQRIAREMRQETEPAKDETGFDAFPPRRNEGGDRYGRVDRGNRGDRGDRGERGDRYAREERVDRREKAKKNQGRRRQAEEDDNWDDDFYEAKRRRKAEKAERERQRLAALEAAGPTPIFLPEFISVSNLAIALGQKIDVFVRQLEELGFEDVGKDNILTGETAALVAQEYGFEPKVDAGEDEDLKPAPASADPSSLPLRPPVVTIMGHVDHGKTTLLDYLRKSSIVSQEHGGITQHIGAFSVSLSSGKQITFLDTPGHAAFLSMRQRGANVTDMVILVVAADDSVMPQTLEALKHARAAKVPIIVAINKIDRPEANVDRVKSDLATHGVEIEDYGGDVQVVCVSGKTGQGMDDLEENILLLSEMLDIRAEPDGMAEGWVLESTIKPIGRVATVLVKRGTLRAGDFIVAGRVHAKVRSLRNEAGVEVDEAPPGTAVEVLGWKEPPEAGDQVLQAPDESKAKAAVRYRQELKERGEVIGQMAQQEQDRREREREREREKALAEAAGGPRNRRHNDRHAAATPAEDVDPETPADTTKYLTFIVKGDVHGSVEAVTAALLEQGNNEIRAKVLISAPGQITESEIEHAAVSGSTIINFNNPVPSNIKRLASDAGVKILDHNVIYHLVEEVRDKLADALPPLIIKKVVGEAEVLQIFPINVRGRVYKNIAGCRIGNGYVKKGSRARVLRGGENIFEGTIETLKHVKKDVQEMKKGSECGMSFANWDELQAGDHIQIIEEITEKRKL